MEILIATSVLGVFYFIALLGSRRFWRTVGFKCHVFKSTHRSGSNRTCIHCGEEQIEYVLWVTGSNPPRWWETSKSGDGSCTEKEQPIRIF